tara:strand:+ start:150 stop:1835 length:1686 start_codon:yes stop_codon:yes gene_type:complete
MKTFKSYQLTELEEGSSDTTDMYALMVKGLKSMPGSPKQKEIIKQINVIRKRMGMKLMKEDFKFDEASKLPPHLAKFFDKKGNPKPEVAARMRKGRALRGVEITDVTPKGYGPKEELELGEVDDRRQRSEREAVNKISKKESEWAKSKRLDKEMENKYEKIHQERDKRYKEQRKNQKQEEVDEDKNALELIKSLKTPQYTIKNTKTGQHYSTSRYQDDGKLNKIRKGGGDHKHAAHYKDGKVIEEVELEEMPNRAYKEKINKHLRNHSGKFKWKDDTLHVEKGIESGVKSTLSKAKVDHPTIKVSDNPMREARNYKQFEKNKSNVSKKDTMKEVEKSNKDQAGIEEARKPYDIYHPTFSAAVQHAKDHTKKAHGFDVDQDSWDREVTFGQRKPSPGKTAIKKVNLTKDGKSVKKRLHMQVYGMDSGKYELNKYVEDYDGPIEDIAKQILTEGNGLTKADIGAMAKKLRVPLVDIISWDHGPGAGGKEWLITLRGGEHLEYMEKSGIVKIPKAANPNMKAMKDYLKNMKSIGGEAPGKIADVKLGKNYLIGGLENAFKLLSR